MARQAKPAKAPGPVKKAIFIPTTRNPTGKLFVPIVRALVSETGTIDFVPRDTKAGFDKEDDAAEFARLIIETLDRIVREHLLRQGFVEQP